MCRRVPTAKTPPLPSLTLWQAVDEAAAVDELRELLIKTQAIQEGALESGWMRWLNGRIH